MLSVFRTRLQGSNKIDFLSLSCEGSPEVYSRSYIQRCKKVSILCTIFIYNYIVKFSLITVNRGPAGVRAQAMDKDGKLVDDFVFDEGTGVIGSRVLHCRNAPSPAATSSMAIAKFVADKLDRDFKL